MNMNESNSTNNSQPIRKTNEYYRRGLEYEASRINGDFVHELNRCSIEINDIMNYIGDPYVPSIVANNVKALAEESMDALNDMNKLVSINNLLGRMEQGLKGNRFPADYVDRFKDYRQKKLEVSKDEYSISELGNIDLFNQLSGGDSIIICTITKIDDEYTVIHPVNSQYISIKTNSKETNFNRYECILTYANGRAILDNGSVLYGFLNEKLRSEFAIINSLFEKQYLPYGIDLLRTPSIQYHQSLRVIYDELKESFKFAVWSQAFKAGIQPRIDEFNKTGAIMDGDLNLGTVNIKIEPHTNDIRDYLNDLYRFAEFAKKDASDLVERYDAE